jgi:hypothetical protein
MRKKSIVTAILALFIIAGLTACPKKGQPRPVRQTPSAVIELKVIPPDAAVIVDGRLVGNAWDLQLLKMSLGPHIIEIRKQGYEPFKGKINAGSTSYLEVELKKIE